MNLSGIWLAIAGIAILVFWFWVFVAGLAVVGVVVRAILTFFLPFNDD